MEKLIEELQTPENVQKIAVLSLNAAFAEMKSTHENFEAVFAYQAECGSPANDQCQRHL